MNTSFTIKYRTSNGNLHVSTSGVFDGTSAWELINLLYERHDGRGRIFIDTENLDEISPQGCGTFKCGIHLGLVPARSIYFKGEKGLQMAPAGSRVLTLRRAGSCKCSGKCTVCKCLHNRQKPSLLEGPR